jgi:hypothetical protein
MFSAPEMPRTDTQDAVRGLTGTGAPTPTRAARRAVTREEWPRIATGEAEDDRYHATLGGRVQQLCAWRWATSGMTNESYRRLVDAGLSGSARRINAMDSFPFTWLAMGK